MPPPSAKCTFMKATGAPCGRSYRVTGIDGTTFTTCANHRNAKTEFAACVGCGALTRAAHSPDGSPMCTRQGCGFNYYQSIWKRRRRASELQAREAEAEAAAQAAAAQELDALVADLVDQFDASTIRPAPQPPPPPPPAWETLSDAARRSIADWVRACENAGAEQPPQRQESAAARACAC